MASFILPVSQPELRDFLAHVIVTARLVFTTSILLYEMYWVPTDNRTDEHPREALSDHLLHPEGNPRHFTPTYPHLGEDHGWEHFPVRV